MAKYSEFQYPMIKGEKFFQNFCLALARKYWADPHAQLHGRQGQAQHGVDIQGHDFVNKQNPVGMQCKGSESHSPRELSEAEITTEVEKAKKFRPELQYLIIAYSGKTDQKIQKHVVSINQDHDSNDLFRVILWSWDNIIDEAIKFPEVIQLLHVENDGATRSIDPKNPSPQNLPVAEAKSALADLENFISLAETTEQGVDIAGNAQLDILKSQIQSGDGRAALAPLRDFVGSLEPTASPRLRFRAYANLGNALLQSDDREAAANAFEEASLAEPGTADALCYASRAATLRRDGAKAYDLARQALAVDPQNALAAALLLDSASAEASIDELSQLTADVANHIDVGWALSRLLGERGEKQAAFEVAVSIEEKDEHWFRGAVVGEATLRFFEDELALRMGAPLTEIQAEQLTDAKEHLSAVWAKAKARDDVGNWTFIAVNLAVALDYLGQQEEADSLIIQTSEMVGNSTQLHRRLILAHLHRKEMDKAVAVLERMEVSASADEYQFIAAIYASADRWSDVVTWAEKALNEGEDNFTKARAAELLLAAELVTSGAESALNLSSALRGRFQPYVAFEARVVEIARRLGDAALLEEARERLREFDQGSLDPFEKFELADAMAQDGNWGSAADLLEGYHAFDRPSEILRRRLYALYRSDRRSYGRTLFESLSGDALQSVEILQMGAAIYDQSGMLPEALAALERAIETEESNLRLRLDWSRLCLRSEQKQKVKEWIATAPTNYEGIPEDIIEYSQLLAMFSRRPESFRLGYDVIMEHWGKSEQLHLGYMSLFFMFPDDNTVVRNPHTVEVDHVVKIKEKNGESKNILIAECENNNPNTLSPNQEFAKILLGKTKGESFTSAPGLGEVKEWVIVEIKHKYLHALHETMQDFPTMFPGSNAFGMVSVNTEREGGLEPIFEQVRARGQYVDRVSDMYGQKRLPIDTVAKLIGNNSVDASAGIRLSKGMQLYSSTGHPIERDQALTSLNTQNRIILDALSVAIWQEIGLLAVVEKTREIEVSVVQSTIDLLAHRALEAEQNVERKGGSLEATPHGVRLNDPTTAELQGFADECAYLCNWVRQNAAVIPTEPWVASLQVDPAEIFLQPTIDTLATAQASGRLMFSDDYQVRAIAREIGASGTCWTQVLLIHLLQKSVIDRAAYVEFIAQLVARNCGFISVGSEDIIESSSRSETNFAQIRTALTQQEVEGQSLVNVVTNAAVELWGDRSRVGDRDKTINSILERMLIRPDGIELIKAVAVATFQELQRNASALDNRASQWSNAVGGFVRGHFLLDEFTS